ncbi:hypothetical protein AB0L06_02285 [Spirillospora sp. NPDC052269]
MLRTARRFLLFTLKGLVSVGLWVARRHHGVPRGAVTVPYSGAQTPMASVLLFTAVLELACVEVLLRAFGTPALVRVPLLVAGIYSVVLVLMLMAACATRPHVLSDDALRVRHGTSLDLRLPRERIRAVRRVRDLDAGPRITVADGVLTVPMASQVNVEIELDGPVRFARPSGEVAEAHTVRFYADDPGQVPMTWRQPPSKVGGLDMS